MGAAMALVFVAIFAGGEIAALGFRVAVTLYGRYWLIWLAIGAALGASFYVVGEALSALVRIRPKLRDELFYAFAGIALLYMIVTLSQRAYRETLAEHPALTQNVTATDIRSRLNAQGLTLNKLSADAQALLSQLDKSESENARVREQLVQTIVAIDKQRSAVATTAVFAKSLSDQQTDNAKRLQELRHLLGGEQPITKHDLEQAQRSGFWQAFLGGVISSIVASFIYRRLPPFSLRKSGLKKPAPPENIAEGPITPNGAA